MDKYEKFKIGNEISRVRVAVPEEPTYSDSNPNPDWYNLGSKWLDYMSIHFQPTKPWNGIGEPDCHNDIAYIPHIQLEIQLARPKPHFILPTEWDYHKLPGVANLYAYSERMIRLNARNYEGHFVGSRHNVDFDISQYADILFDLLKIAETTNQPPE